jgi:alginate O-acetyltransferase complex protein AlgI
VNNFLAALLTFFLINITWVFFRSPDFTTAWSLLLSMFGQMPGGTAILPTLDIIKVVVVISGMVAVHWLMRDKVLLEVAFKLPWYILATIWAGMLILLIASQESSNSFIYFQF